MAFDKKTVVVAFGVSALVIACGFLAVRAGHSTAGPTGTFEGTGQIPGLSGDDFQITLLDASGDSTRVEVTLRAEGREDLGPVDLMPVFLVDSTSRNFASYGRSDPDDRRKITYGFIGLLGNGPWRVEGDSISAGEPGVQGSAKRFRVAKVWSIDLPPIDTSADTSLSPDGAARVALGPAFAVIDEVVVTSTRVVIRGRFERIVGRLIPGIHPVPVLVDAAGTTVAFANGRSGYGKDRANFEFAYPRTVPGPATFSIKLQAQENPSTREFDVPFRVQLAALDGAIAEWQVTLP